MSYHGDLHFGVGCNHVSRMAWRIEILSFPWRFGRFGGFGTWCQMCTLHVSLVQIMGKQLVDKRKLQPAGRAAKASAKNRASKFGMACNTLARRQVMLREVSALDFVQFSSCRMSRLWKWIKALPRKCCCKLVCYHQMWRPCLLHVGVARQRTLWRTKLVSGAKRRVAVLGVEWQMQK